MRIVTLALTAAIGLAAAPVPAQTADPPPVASPSSPPEIVPAPAQQVPTQDMPAQQPQKQAPPASQSQQAQEQVPPAAAPQARTAMPSPPPLPEPSRRYSFNRVDDGFVRFDNATGQVAYCSPHTVGWACQAVSEDRAALDREIAHLKEEVATLKEEIVKLRAAPSPAPPAPPAASPPPAGEGDEIRLKLPTHEDLARAQAYLADTWHRLVEMIDRFQRNLRDGGRDAAEDTSSI